METSGLDIVFPISTEHYGISLGGTPLLTGDWKSADLTKAQNRSDEYFEPRMIELDEIVDDFEP